MQPTLKKTIRNSEVTVAKEKRSFLTYPANGLAPCTLEETEDSINLLFSTQGCEIAESILKKQKLEQLRFLANCASLETLIEEYDFALSLDNMLVDINLIPSLLVRDAKKSNSGEFFPIYMSLIGSVLLPKYKYEDYLQGGQVHYKKNKLLNELSTKQTADEIKTCLLTEHHNLLQEQNTTKKLVRKRNVWLSRITIPLLSIALAAVIFFGGHMFLVDIPFRDSVITANTAYINGDFLSVQAALRAHDLPALSVETRYFLSRSYVSTEALTETQRENILIGLAQRTDPIIFDYWILLGRLRFGEAVDIAQRLGDDELLLFAYLKQEAFVRQDISMPGEYRTELLAYLERHIDRLNEARDSAVENLSN